MRPLADPGRPVPVRRPVQPSARHPGSLRRMPSFGGRRQSREESREAAVDARCSPAGTPPHPIRRHRQGGIRAPDGLSPNTTAGWPGLPRAIIH